MSNELKEKLQDATAAFTFSRLPREQRIARILSDILRNQSRAIGVPGDGPEECLAVAEELAQYSVKDFAVRYGHLADGKA